VNFDSKAVGKLDRVEGAGYQMTEIVIMPRLLIRHAKDLERARRILEKAERNCLISNSIKSAVKLEAQEVRAEDEE
jgi:organic hydroperoxide reductase OsmC/OhrA